MYTILVCDDETDIRNALRIYLTQADYQVLEAENGRQALDILAQHEVHLVLLDVMMPVMDGLTALAEIRRKSAVPVILLTAKSEDGDKLAGFNLGSDDYVTKPFNAMEVLARVRAVLRRIARQEEILETPSLLRQGGVELDDEAKRVTVEGDEISVTPKEYDILKLFLENPGRVFSSQEIYQKVWRDIPLGTEGTVAVHIRHLREKLEINPAEPRYIKVVWGKGYKLERQA
jgi:DNA-binding response OmpR family regulator